MSLPQAVAPLARPLTRPNPPDIPALVVDAGTPSETVVTESAAVLTYLAALGGPEAEARLLGRDALRRGQTAELLTFTSATIHGQGYGSIWRPLRFTDDEAAWSGVQAKGRAVVEWAYGVLEQKLAGRPAAAAAASGAGDGDVGVADIYAYVFWRWGVELGLDMKGKFPRYYSVAKRVEGLASVQKTLQVEELAPLAA